MTTANANTSVAATCDTRARRCILGLIGTHLILVLFAVLMFAAGFADYKWPRWQSLLIEALCLGQLGLLATLLVLGTARFSVRMIAFAIVLTFWLIVFLDLGLDHEDWLIIFFIQIAGVSCILVVLRQFGVRVTRRHLTAEAASKTKYRFSLRQMLVWTAAASFLLGLGTVVWRFPGFQPSIDWAVVPRAKVLGISLVAIMLVALWATLGTARRITPLCLLALVTVVASMWVARTDQLHRTAWWSTLPREYYPAAYFLLVCAYAVTVYLSLTLLRTGGYRLGRL